MARRAIEKDTLRNVALLSRNRCAFPGCNHPIMDPSGTLIGQLCHIEAAEPGGERYNAGQTDDERRAAANLIFLCLPHHQVTNDTSRYDVPTLKKMKAEHEALPPSAYNPDKLVDAIIRLEEKSAKLGGLVEGIIKQESKKSASGYAIHTPDGRGPWVPEQGKFYDYPLDNGTKFRVMMKGDIAHIEQTLQDGAIAYYEVNEAGDLKQNKMPYPLEEYRLEIPPGMIVSKSPRPYAPGLTETVYILKWGRSVRTVTDGAGRLAELDLHARITISHPERLFRVIEPSR